MCVVKMMMIKMKIWYQRGFGASRGRHCGVRELEEVIHMDGVCKKKQGGTLFCKNK